MRIQGFRDHYQHVDKNLILDEGFFVYTNGQPTQGTTEGEEEEAKKAAEAAQAAQAAKPKEQGFNEEEYLMPKHIERLMEKESPLVAEVKKMVPGKVEYDDPKKKKEIEETWQTVLTEYNGIQAYVDHFTKLKERVERADFDPKSERWRARMARIYKSFDEFENVRKVVTLPEKTKRGIAERQRTDIAHEKTAIQEDLRDIITELIITRGRVLAELEKQMRSDFESRLNYIEKQWKEHPPRGYEGDPQKNWLKLIEDARKALANLPKLMSEEPKFSADDKRIKEYREIWDALDRFEDSYFEAGTGQDADFDLKKLEKELNRLEALKAKEVDPIAGKYTETMDKLLEEYKELIGIYEAKVKKLEEEEHKEKEIKELKKTIEGLKESEKNLEKNRDVSKLFDDALHGDGAFQKDGKDIIWKIGDKEVKLPNSLKGQIELLKILPLNAEEKRQFGLKLKEAFLICERSIKGAQPYMNEDLPIVLEKLRLQKKGLSLPEGKEVYKWNMLAPADITRVLHIIQEWAPRKYKRAADGRVGAFGGEALKFLNDAPWPLSPLRSLPHEFEKEAEHAESQEYNHYKEIYAHTDMWEVEHIASVTRNQDELKGCLLLLAERGRLRWDRAWLWKQLNRFQKTVSIPMDLAVNLSDTVKFYDNLRRACGVIWDYDTFNQMKNSNSSGYDNEKQKYYKNCDEWAESEGGLTKVIDGLLTRYKEKGEHQAKVDPILYEAIIDYGIQKGKMHPEEKLYYLIQGIGTGILAPDRGSVIKSIHINNYPAIDYFGSSTKRGGKPTLADIKEVALYDKTGFNEWFHTVAMTLPRNTQRVEKTLTQGNRLDHDDLTAYLCYMGEQTTETMLKAHADGFRLPQTGVQNATVSMLFYIDNMAENHKKMPEYDKELARFVGSFTRFDGILSNNMYSNKDGWFRWTPDNYKSIPRSAGNYEYMYGRDGDSGYHDMTSQENMEEVRKYLTILDPNYFGKLYSGSIKTNEEAQKFAADIEREHNAKVFGTETPKSVDDLYKSGGAYAGWLVQNRPERVKDMFEKIREDHQKAFEKIKAAGYKTMPERREEVKIAIEHFYHERKEKLMTGAPLEEGDAHAHGHGEKGGH